MGSIFLVYILACHQPSKPSKNLLVKVEVWSNSEIVIILYLIRSNRCICLIARTDKQVNFNRSVAQDVRHGAFPPAVTSNNRHHLFFINLVIYLLTFSGNFLESFLTHTTITPKFQGAFLTIDVIAVLKIEKCGHFVWEV